MSMLPPPMIDRLSRLDLREFSAFSCRGSVVPATGVTARLPTNWTYEYSIVSRSLGGRLFVLNVVAPAEAVFGARGSWTSRTGGDRPRPRSSKVLDRSGRRRGKWLLVRTFAWRSCRLKPGAVPVTGGVEVGHEVGVPDPGELSDMGSSERENERFEGVAGTDISCGCGN